MLDESRGEGGSAALTNIDEAGEASHSSAAPTMGVAAASVGSQPSEVQEDPGTQAYVEGVAWHGEADALDDVAPTSPMEEVASLHGTNIMIMRTVIQTVY